MRTRCRIVRDITKRGPSYVFLHSILVRNRLTIDNSKFVEIYSKETLEYVYIKFMDTPLYREKDQELNNNEFGNKFPPRLVKRNKKKEKKKYRLPIINVYIVTCL